MNAKSTKRIAGLLIVFLLTVAALVAVMANTAQAALDKQSETYEATIELTSLDVGLTENGDIHEGKDTLLTNLIPDGQKISFGKWYPEELAAQNTGDQPEYMRVVVHRYWLDEGGDKTTNMDPSLIELKLAKGWVVDESASTAEQIVLYSVDPVAVGASLPFTSEMRIGADVLKDAKSVVVSSADAGAKTAGGQAYSYTEYAYDNYKFGISVEVDAVQTHNAADAIKGAWGVDANSLGINVGGAA